jgi:hypothetical protein
MVGVKAGGQSKVGQFDVPILVDQDIVGFDIPNVNYDL